MGRFLFLLAIQLGAYLVLRRLWPGVRQGWRHGVVLAGTALSLGGWLLPLATGHGFALSATSLPPLKVFSLGWGIAALVVVLLGVPVLLVRRWMERPRPAAPVDLKRRSLVMNVGRAVPVLAVGASTTGVVGGGVGFQVKEVEMKIKGLPKALDGFRIGQISDVHVGPFIDTDYLRAAVETMNQAGAHLQVMTGDLIDDLEHVDATMEALAACKAPHGMLAILGNHEHWRGLDRVLEGYATLARRGAPVRLLVDESHVLEHEGQRVRVVGVDYPMSGRSHRVKEERMRRSADVAFRDAPEDAWTLCLSHHPDFFPHAAEKGAGLTLSGHTHGGQVALLGLPVFFFAFKYMLGRYRHQDSHLYVSGGTGHWMPFRIGVPTEVTLLTLRPA